MSLFESVFVKLECQRCGIVDKTVVRFRSYAGPPDGEYELMEVIPQGLGLWRGEVWEGNADRYCWKCLQKWAETQAYASYDALGELVEKGLVTARAKRSATPLTPSEIKKYAEKYARECRKEGAVYVTMPFFEEFDLTIRDKPCHPLDLDLLETDESKSIEADQIWSELLLHIDPLISERMKNQGWVADETWEDFNVLLDDARRIVVEDMEGKRLTRDGARIAK